MPLQALPIKHVPNKSRIFPEPWKRIDAFIKILRPNTLLFHIFIFSRICMRARQQVSLPWLFSFLLTFCFINHGTTKHFQSNEIILRGQNWVIFSGLWIWKQKIKMYEILQNFSEKSPGPIIDQDRDKDWIFNSIRLGKKDDDLEVGEKVTTVENFVLCLSKMFVFF